MGEGPTLGAARRASAGVGRGSIERFDPAMIASVQARACFLQRWRKLVASSTAIVRKARGGVPGGARRRCDSGALVAQAGAASEQELLAACAALETARYQGQVAAKAAPRSCAQLRVLRAVLTTAGSGQAVLGLLRSARRLAVD